MPQSTCLVKDFGRGGRIRRRRVQATLEGSVNRSVRRLRAALAVVCVIAVALVGLLDYVTGPWVSFAVFYVLPVLAAAWWLGRGPALLAGMTAGIAWFEAEAWGHRGEPTRDLMWNSLTRLLMLVAMAAMVVRIRDD